MTTIKILICCLTTIFTIAAFATFGTAMTRQLKHRQHFNKIKLVNSWIECIISSLSAALFLSVWYLLCTDKPTEFYLTWITIYITMATISRTAQKMTKI